MPQKQNVVLHLDKEVISKSRELGFDLSRTCENHLEQLTNNFQLLLITKNSGKKPIWWAGPELNQRPSARQAPGIPIEELLVKFREFLKVDLRRSDKTAYEHTYYVRKFLNELPKTVEATCADDIRAYLKSLSGKSSATYKNTLMALKVFYRDFLGLPEAVQSFKFPHQNFKPKHIFTRDQIRLFFENLVTLKERALFMLYATTGLRREEILSLKPENVDFEKRMITPNNHNGETKKSWVSFYNKEAEQALNLYLAIKKPSKSKRLFPMQRMEMVELWKTARNKSGLDVTPQRLREWFCSEMTTKGVSDCFIDAFCGRTPKSVLARHYTDYSPEKLSELYEKAQLNILDQPCGIVMTNDKLTSDLS